jgi:hypothetical protein
MFLLVPVTILFLHEQRMKIPSRELRDNARTQLVKIGAATAMWLAAGLMTLFYIAPDLSTVLFYKQQNDCTSIRRLRDIAVSRRRFRISGSAGYGYFAGICALCLSCACCSRRRPISATCSIRPSGTPASSRDSTVLVSRSPNWRWMDLAIRVTPHGSEGPPS